MASHSRTDEYHHRSDQASPAPSDGLRTDKEKFPENRSNHATRKNHLRIQNVPSSWSFHQVSAYIKKHTASDKAIADDITFIKMTPRNEDEGSYNQDQEADVSFKTDSSCKQAFQLLKLVYERVEGKKLYVSLFDPYAFKAKNFTHQQPQQSPYNYHNANHSVFISSNLDDNETYGLSDQYLNDIGITSRPLSRWVFVRNLPEQYKDVAKVREIFEKAGAIDTAQVIESKKGASYYNARISYDHPVEAVQAVSMFNNRDVFGFIIKCEMDFMKKNDLKMEGIPSKGPGLGPEGSAMRGVRVSVEIKKAKNDLMLEINKMSDSIEELKAQVNTLYMQVESQKAELARANQNAANQIAANQNAANPMATLGNLLTNQLQPMLLQGLLQQNTGNEMNPLANVLKNLTSGNVDLSSVLQQVQPNMPNLGANMQAGSQIGSSTIQQVSNNMQSGPNNMQDGHMQNMSNNMAGSLANMQSGSQNHGNLNAFSQQDNAGFNAPIQASGFGNMHAGFSNTQQSYGQGQYNHRSANESNSTKPRVCFICGNKGHIASLCRKRPNAPSESHQSSDAKKARPAATCHTCQQPGHKMAMCPFKQIGDNPQMSKPKYNQNDNDEPTTNSFMLLFRNLPSSVTLPILQGKMREVGEVRLVEMTGAGRALVGFYSEFDADKCIRLFNASKVDGQVVEVIRV